MLTSRSKRVATAMASLLAIGTLGACRPAPYSSGFVASVGANPSAGAQVSVAPALPAVAATTDPLAVAAGNALWALWYDDPTYAAKLDAVVPEVAFRTQVSATALTRTWTATTKQRMIAVLSALTQVGVPYRRLQMAEGKGFDCSGLTGWAWKQAGVKLPRSSGQQMSAAAARDLSVTEPGDLVYYPGHVTMALGVGTAVVHSPFTGRTVEVRPTPRSSLRSVRAASPI